MNASIAGLSHRPYAGLADLRLMKATLTANLLAGFSSFHRGDLDWWIFSLLLGGVSEEKTELWFRAGECIGWVFFIEAAANYDVVVHPDWRGSASERELLRWADARLTAAARRLGRNCVQAFVFADHAFQREVLHELGYVESDEDTILYSQPLSPSLPAPSLPPGYRWLPPMRPEWAAARAAAHADAFHPSKMTAAAYRRFMRASPDYEGDLDIVIVAADGQSVAFAKVWLDDEARVGIFEPVGTRRDHQRLGLGRAVLRAGLRRMQARGMRVAQVGCDAKKAGNQAFYRALGFRERTRVLSCERVLAG